MSPFAPIAPHSSATSITRSFGTTITATSRASGKSATDGYERIEQTEVAFGLTGKTAPVNPSATRL